jgi:tetratricopeptide (TPR) repeat protein
MKQQGEQEAATDLFERALAMARRIDHGELEARILNSTAIARRELGQFDDSVRLLHESLAVARRIDNARCQSNALGNLVIAWIDLGDYARAARAAEESMAINAANGDDWGLALNRLNYTTAILNAEGPAVAQGRLREWARSILSFGDRVLGIHVQELGAAIAAGLAEPDTAAKLLGAADTGRAALPMPRSAAENALVEKWLQPARRALDDAEWAAFYESGCGLTPEGAIELVLAIGVREPT